LTYSENDGARREAAITMTFDPRCIPGPKLVDLPDHRFEELRYLEKEIRRRPAKPTELLCEVTRQLSRIVVEELRDVLSGGASSVREHLIRAGGLHRKGSMTEDEFLAIAWLVLAQQALGQEEAGPLGVRVALERARDDAPAYDS